MIRCAFCGSPAAFLPPRWFRRWRKVRPHHAGGAPCPGRTEYDAPEITWSQDFEAAKQANLAKRKEAPRGGDVS